MWRNREGYKQENIPLDRPPSTATPLSYCTSPTHTICLWITYLVCVYILQIAREHTFCFHGNSHFAFIL